MPRYLGEPDWAKEPLCETRGYHVTDSECEACYDERRNPGWMRSHQQCKKLNLILSPEEQKRRVRRE